MFANAFRKGKAEETVLLNRCIDEGRKGSVPVAIAGCETHRKNRLTDLCVAKATSGSLPENIWPFLPWFVGGLEATKRVDLSQGDRSL